MRRFTKGLMVLSAAALLAVAPAIAQGMEPHGPGGPGPGMIAHMTQELGLTKDQQATMEAILSKYMDGTLGQKMHSMREARDTLAQTIHNPDATDQQVQDAAGVVSTIDWAIATEQHHMVIEMAAILTADQRAKLAQLKPPHRDHGDGPPPHGGGGY